MFISSWATGRHHCFGPIGVSLLIVMLQGISVQYWVRKESKPLKIGFGFYINFTKVTKAFMIQMNQDEYNQLVLGSIRISCVSAKHTNVCSPSQNQYVLCKKKSGEYDIVTSQILHQIVSYSTLKLIGLLM